MSEQVENNAVQADPPRTYDGSLPDKHEYLNTEDIDLTRIYHDDPFCRRVRIPEGTTMSMLAVTSNFVRMPGQYMPLIVFDGPVFEELQRLATGPGEPLFVHVPREKETSYVNRGVLCRITAYKIITRANATSSYKSIHLICAITQIVDFERYYVLPDGSIYNHFTAFPNTPVVIRDECLSVIVRRELEHRGPRMPGSPLPRNFWPNLMGKAKRYLQSLGTPEAVIQRYANGEESYFSYYLVESMALSFREKYDMLNANFVEQRISQSLRIANRLKQICCNNCHTVIATPDKLLRVSDNSIAPFFSNIHGFCHSALTIMPTTAYLMDGRFTDEVSWFPGYAWRYVFCECGDHLGWMFTNPRMNPNEFVGLSVDNLLFERVPEEGSILSEASLE